MNWVQDQCMMLSSQAPPQGGVSATAGPHTPAIHCLPNAANPHQPSSQIAYEGRVSLMSPGSAQPWPHPQHFNQFNSLNFNFSPFKNKEGGSLGIPFPLDNDRETSPSSAGSPRTDDTVDKSSGLDKTHEILEKSFEPPSSEPQRGPDCEEEEDREEGPLSIHEEPDELHVTEEYTTEEEASSPVKDDEPLAQSDPEIPQHYQREEQNGLHPSSEGNGEMLHHGRPDMPEVSARLKTVLAGGELPPYLKANLGGVDADVPPMPLLSIRRDIGGGGGDGEDRRNIADDKLEEDFDEEEELRIDEEMDDEDRG